VLLQPAAMAAADYEMEEEVRRMRAVFHEFDTDGSGTIDARELTAAMARLGRSLSLAEARAMLSDAAAAGGGSGRGSAGIDFEAFAAAMASQSAKVEWGELRGSLVELGSGGKAMSVSVGAEMQVTVRRLQAAQESADISEIQAAVDAADRLLARATSAAAAAAAPPGAGLAELCELRGALVRRVAAEPELSQPSRLFRSALVRGKVKRLWDLMAIESEAMREQGRQQHAALLHESPHAFMVCDASCQPASRPRPPSASDDDGDDPRRRARCRWTWSRARRPQLR
jgi:hypothetical protein